MALLETRDLTISFGGLMAVANVDLCLQQGELVGLIGPNGAGKTTIFNLLTGVYRPTRGEIIFNGQSLVGLKPYQITQRGIARTFQNIRLFGDLSVLDNVRIAYHWHSRYGILNAILRLPSFHQGEAAILARSQELLRIFKLETYQHEKAKNLPYGEQRRLEIARALAARPKLLLLDEPAAGMNPQETKELMALINWVRQEFDLTILLIEHDMSLVMGICERIYVLDYGQVIAEGPPQAIRNNERVIEAYLGREVNGVAPQGRKS
ncbi:ABC transporter-like [Moorella glycerini]|uniref:Lipopolysaccharide export system ATP-binding protein LptB n=1 Tax=Neomoorella stamsii TaxID=1266720 RepID=A0A9X7P6I8_9FIRM|nr:MULTISPECIES: ABC transporter ATP-binding protein [Moorella]PRR73072.1 Lipopolysaccharide export system ATP-binding protein LptB [Moorella stamsii]CEP67710.1 ABC transporter-like [Moorella glycerini]